MNRIYVIERKSKRGKVWRFFDATESKRNARFKRRYDAQCAPDTDYRIAIYERKEVLP